MVECTLSITHYLRLNLQLHTIDLVRTCRISSFCTVAWQLARFQLTRRIARSSAIAELLVLRMRVNDWLVDCEEGQESTVEKIWREPRVKEWGSTELWGMRVVNRDLQR